MRFDPRSSTGWERAAVLVQALLRPSLHRFAAKIYSVGVGGILEIVVVQMRFDPRSSTGWEQAAALVQALLTPTMHRFAANI